MSCVLWGFYFIDLRRFLGVLGFTFNGFFFYSLGDLLNDLIQGRFKAPPKRSCQRNMVGRNMLRAFGHRVANLRSYPPSLTLRGRKKHVWSQVTVSRCVATCLVLLAQIWPASNSSQQHATCCNMSPLGGQTSATCCAQQCWDMLRWMLRSFVRGLSLAE